MKSPLGRAARTSPGPPFDQLLVFELAGAGWAGQHKRAERAFDRMVAADPPW